MSVCKYFLQGRCRFGQNCRFEHSFGNDDKSNRNVLNSQQLSTIVKKVAEAVILAEKGGQWPLSCFSPLKEGTNVPGWEDYSPEEIRWKMYEARANGTLNQITQEINQLYRNAEKMRDILKEPTMERVNIIANLIKDKSEPSNVSNPFTSFSSSSNIFGGSVQSSSTQSIFGNNSSPGSQASIFGGSTTLGGGNSGNIFGGSSQYSGNIFGNAVCFPNNSNSNIFGNSVSSSAFSQSSLSNSQNAAQSGNIFGNTVSSQNAFSNISKGINQNISNAFLPQSSSGIFSNSSSLYDSKKNESNPSLSFQSNQTGSILPTQNSFSKTDIFNSKQQFTKSAFGGVNQQVSAEFDSSIYSEIKDLNEEEIKSFTSATFAFGKIPVKPPPKEYCV